MATTGARGEQIRDGTLTDADFGGVLTVGKGGTGAGSQTLNNVLLGNGTGALQNIAPSTVGKVLRSNGTTWLSAALAAADISDSTTVGRALIAAADAAAARSAIGAGTGNSNLAVGATSSDAKAGDYQPTWTQVTSKPTTFAPIIGSGAADAVAGNDPRLGVRAIAVSNTTSWTIDTDTYEYAENTGLTGTVTVNAPTGTKVRGQKLWISITGTASRTITWNAAFEASGTIALPTTTSGTTRLDVGFMWNVATSKWRIAGVS